MTIKKLVAAPINPDVHIVSSSVEQSALGIVFLRDSAFYEMVAGGLSLELFGLDSHRRIFLAMHRIAARREIISIVAVCDELEKAKDLEPIGGVGYLSWLVDGIAESDNVKQYVAILQEKYLRRRMLQL